MFFFGRVVCRWQLPSILGSYVATRVLCVTLNGQFFQMFKPHNISMDRFWMFSTPILGALRQALGLPHGEYREGSTLGLFSKGLTVDLLIPPPPYSALLMLGFRCYYREKGRALGEFSAPVDAL